jgi:hypothetical protein
VLSREMAREDLRRSGLVPAEDESVFCAQVQRILDTEALQGTAAMLARVLA